MCSVWTYWRILQYKIQVHSKESYAIVLYTPIVFRGNQSIIVLYTTIDFKKSKYYCIAKSAQRKKYYYNMNYIQGKKMNQIYYIHILFETLHCELFKRFHIQGTNHSNCHLGGLNTHCCQLDSLMIVKY